MFGVLGKLETNSMNTSQFMDKQIMDLSSFQNKSNADKDVMDLNNNSPQEDHRDGVGGGDNNRDEILPNYDFHPIRATASSQPSNSESANVGGSRVWGSVGSNINFNTRNNDALLLEIDKTMKKHADDLMHALEGVSARLTQLETRSRNLENSMDDLRTSVGNNHGNTDGKLRLIENIIREVQTGVQVVKDKQEILEAQLQLSQINITKREQQPESQQPASAHQQSHQQPPPVALPPPLPNAPPPPNPQNLAPSIQHPNQFPQNIMPIPQHDSYYQPTPGQTAEPPPHHYQLPPPQLQPSPQPPTNIQYPQPPPMSLQQQHPSSHPNPSMSQPPLNHHSEELPYLSSQNYPPRQLGGAPTQFQGNPTQMYEQPSRVGFGEGFNYGGPQYGSGSPIKPQQPSSPNMGHGSGGGYPQLPTARILPQALPTAAAGGGGGNRVPIDDVVDKVTNMGFPRDQVRGTVRKLTENGQAVDLNVVLDKLMTDGVESQGPRLWYGR